MSASTSPVVSPWKGKYARSAGSTISHSTLAPNRHHELKTHVIGASSLPPGLDLNTLDPDDAFVKLSIREIQGIEADLQASHEQLSQTLKSLVAERYRDMLGTANTLIEMSSSASKLVSKLDAVRDGVTATNSASRPRDTEMSEVVDYLKMSNQDGRMDEVSDSNTLAIAAVTKLLAEAPDEVWRALDATSPKFLQEATSKRLNSGRKLRNRNAANVLKAALIIMLCQRAWKWLTTAAYTNEAQVSSLFPYIANQWSSLLPMKSDVLKIAHKGLAGSFSAKEPSSTHWQDDSSSYIAYLSYTLAEALLQRSSLITCRENLFKMRKQAVEERLKNKALIPSQSLAQSIKDVTDTVTHCMLAFNLVDDDHDTPHLARIFAAMSQSSARAIQFPPSIQDILITLPSGGTFIRLLPQELVQYTPLMKHDDALECQQTTVQEVKRWCEAIREEGQSSHYKASIDRIDTISIIGEAQIRVRESLDRSLSLIEKLVKRKEPREILQNEVRSFVILVERLLLERAEILCRERTAELSLSISESTSSALKALNTADGVNGHDKKKDTRMEMERIPMRFALQANEPGVNMQTRLRLLTPLIQMVLSSVEGRAQILAREMESYSSHIEMDAIKRTKRRHKEDIHTDITGEAANIDKQIARVLESYRTAFDSARLVLVDELKNQLVRQEMMKGFSSKMESALQNLLIARIASALQKSNVLRSTATVADKSNDEIFMQKLTTLRESIIDDWVSQSVQQAVEMYKSTIKEIPDPRNDEQSQGRPTTALAEALLQLIDCIDATGCGYQSEARKLGKHVLMQFVRLWIEQSSLIAEENKSCYTYDSQVLLILIREHEGVQKDVNALSHICGASTLNQTEQTMMEIAVQKLRLVLHPLRQIQDSSLQIQMTPGHTVNSAAPLPMLSLVAARDKIPLL